MVIKDSVLAGAIPAIPRPIVRRISSRYIAGDTLEDAVRAVRDLNAEGCAATVDVLGEHIEDESSIAEKVRDYKGIVDAIDLHSLNAGVSPRPTSLGLVLSKDVCQANLEEIVSYAGEKGCFVEVAMEDSPYTTATLQMVTELHQMHSNVGAVLQAYMRRSLLDATNLANSGLSVRLCKGIYDEPRTLAYKDSETVRENFTLLLEELLRGGSYVGIATHDEYLVWHTLRLIHQLEIPKDRYEFQMLLGVDEELRGILVGMGHKVRVYVPYGEQWYEYSNRRLKENPKIAGYVARDVLNSLATMGRKGLNGGPFTSLKKLVHSTGKRGGKS